MRAERFAPVPPHRRGPAAPPAYRLNITLTASTLSMIVDINSGRPDSQNYALNATYTLRTSRPASPSSIAKPSRE
jgi:hypothetical protein